MPSDKTVAKARRAVRLLRTLPTPPRRTPTRARHSALHYRAHTLRDERAPGGGPGRGSTPCGITSVRPPGVHLAHSGRRLVPAAKLCPRTLFRRDRSAPCTLGTARATRSAPLLATGDEHCATWLLGGIAGDVCHQAPRQMLYPAQPLEKRNFSGAHTPHVRWDDERTREQ